MSSNVPLFGLAVLAVIGAVLSQTAPKPESWWQASFDIIDADGDIKVSPEEFRDAMQDMGWALTLQQQHAAFAQYDPAGDGFSYGEFKQAWNNTLAFSGNQSPNVPNDVQFAQVDRNKDGYFVLEELINGAYIAGYGFNEAELAVIFDKYDRYPKDGKVNYCELLAYYNQVSFD